MALSNWDCLAFDAEGNPGCGEVRNETSSVEIYKNWVYVTFPLKVKKGAPNIHQVQEGDVQFAGGFRVLAKRHEGQNAVFVFVEESCKPVMAGVGCYGYSGEGDFVGVLPETVDAFWAWLVQVLGGQHSDWLNKINSSERVRVNQGDRFFSKALGVDDQATEVGEAQEPILSKVAKSLSKS